MKNQFFHQMAAENEFFHQFFPGLSVSGSFGAQPVRFTFPVSFQRFQYTCHSVIRTSHNTRLLDQYLNQYNQYTTVKGVFSPLQLIPIQIVASAILEKKTIHLVQEYPIEENESRMCLKALVTFLLFQNLSVKQKKTVCKHCLQFGTFITTQQVVFCIKSTSQKGLNSYNIIFHLENDKMSDQFFTMRSFWETLSFLRFQQNVANPFLYFKQQKIFCAPIMRPM